MKYYKENLTKKRQKLEAESGNVMRLRKNMEEREKK